LAGAPPRQRTPSLDIPEVVESRPGDADYLCVSAWSFLLVLLAGSVMAGVLVMGYLRDAKRRQALVSYCASMGWSYYAEDDSYTVRWNGTPFGVGDRRRATNVLTGSDRGVPFVALDYQYDAESTDSHGRRSRTTHRYSVVAVGLPTVLPRLEVTPEGLLRRAAAAVGLGSDIELESEDFNRHFVVHARQPKFASDVLTPRTMEALLAAPPLAWRIEMSDLVSWDSGRLEPVDVLARLATLHRVVDGIPSFVWHDNGMGQEPAAQVVPPPPPVVAAPVPDTPAPDPRGDSGAPTPPVVENGQNIQSGHGIENGHDYGTVLSPHQSGPAVPAPPSEGSSA
jgi:hypothetical protein